MNRSKKLLMMFMLMSALGSAVVPWNSVSAATIQSVNSRSVVARLSITDGIARCTINGANRETATRTSVANY